MKPQGLIMRTAERQRQTPAKTMTNAVTGEAGNASTTSDQILGEIRDYCRRTRTAESTFGRLVVNDGKLVSRLRDGAKITTGTLDKVRAYLTEHRTAASSAQIAAQPTAKQVNGSAAAQPIAPAGFRFFDNRQKYLLF